MMGLETSGSDYDDILAIANCLAETGHEVKVLHQRCGFSMVKN